MRDEFDRVTEPSVVDDLNFEKCGEAVSSWYECLNGQTTIKDSLAILCGLLRVEAGLICRAHGQGKSLAKTIFFDIAEKHPTLLSAQKSYALSVLGVHGYSAKVGSVWVLSELDNPTDDPRLNEFQCTRGFRDYVVIVLANSSGDLDLLELHSFSMISAAQVSLLNALVPLLVRAWRNRRVGTVSLELSKRPFILDVAKSDAPILSSDNPFGLSRSEYRVCHLMKGGLLPNALPQELSKSPATIRTHLRNIFSKTGAKSQAELLFRLMSKDEDRLVDAPVREMRA